MLILAYKLYITQSKIYLFNKSETKQKQRPMKCDKDQVWQPFPKKNGVLYVNRSSSVTGLLAIVEKLFSIGSQDMF